MAGGGGGGASAALFVVTSLVGVGLAAIGYWYLQTSSPTSSSANTSKSEDYPGAKPLSDEERKKYGGKYPVTHALGVGATPAAPLSPKIASAPAVKAPPVNTTEEETTHSIVPPAPVKAPAAPPSSPAKTNVAAAAPSSPQKTVQAAPASTLTLPPTDDVESPKVAEHVTQAPGSTSLQPQEAAAAVFSSPTKTKSHEKAVAPQSPPKAEAVSPIANSPVKSDSPASPPTRSPVKSESPTKQSAAASPKKPESSPSEEVTTPLSPTKEVPVKSLDDDFALTEATAHELASSFVEDVLSSSVEQLQEEYVQVELTASTEDLREVPLVKKSTMKKDEVETLVPPPPAVEKMEKKKPKEAAATSVSPVKASPKKPLSRKSSSSSVKSSGDKKTTTASPSPPASPAKTTTPLPPPSSPPASPTPAAATATEDAGDAPSSPHVNDGSASPLDDASAKKSKAKKKKAGKKRR